MTNAETNDKPGNVAEQGANIAPEPAVSKNEATQRKGDAKGRKTAKRAKTKAAAPKKRVKAKETGRKAAKGTGKKATKSTRAKSATPRAESKGAKILEIIGHAKGATLAEIMKATDWQAYSVRGFVSTAGKKHGIKIESAKNEAGHRVYRIAR